MARVPKLMQDEGEKYEKQKEEKKKKEKERHGFCNNKNVLYSPVFVPQPEMLGHS